MTWRHLLVSIEATVVLLGFTGSRSFAENPGDDSWIPDDNPDKADIMERRAEYQRLHPVDRSTILQRIDRILRPLYSNDERAQLTDSLSGAALELLGGPALGTVPVSDLAECISQASDKYYTEACVTFVKGVVSTAAGYGSTLIVPATVPFVGPIVIAGITSYSVKKIFDAILNPPEKKYHTKSEPAGEIKLPPAAGPKLLGQLDGLMGTPGDGAGGNGLSGQEPAIDAIPSIISGGQVGSVLDGHLDSRDAQTIAKAATGFGIMDTHRKTTKAANAGADKLAEASKTREQAEREVMGIMEDLRSEIAKADRENSWNKAIGDAIQTGIEAGGTAFGTAIGAGLADKTTKAIFDKNKRGTGPGSNSGGSSGGSGSSTGGSSSSGSSGSGGGGGTSTSGSSSSGGSSTGSSSTPAAGTNTTGTTSGTNAPTSGTNTTTTTTTTTAGSTTTTADNRFQCPVCGSKNTTFLHYNETTGYGEAVYKCNGCGNTVH